MGEIDERDVRLGADRKPADIGAAQRIRTARRGRVKHLGRARKADIAAGDPGEHRREPHLLDEVVGRHVGADADVDPGRPVASEVLQRMAIASEGARAVRDRGSGIGEQGNVVGRPVMQPGVAVDEDGMTESHARSEDPDTARPLDGRQTVPAHHRLKLVDALGRMHRDGEVEVLGRRRRVPQEILGAGVDLNGQTTPESRPEGWRATSPRISSAAAKSRSPPASSQV